MPYARRGKCVVKKSDGSVVPGGCHKTEAEARAHLAALEIHVHETHGKGYNPNQPRFPAGSSAGGEWMSVGGGFSPLSSIATFTKSSYSQETWDPVRETKGPTHLDVSEGIKAIDSVHRFPSRVPKLIIDIPEEPNLGANYDPDTHIITIGKSGSDRSGALIHEVGHFLDHEGFQSRGKYASDSKKSDVTKIMDAIKTTNGYRYWAEGKANKYVIDPRFPDIKVHIPRNWARYYSSPVEFFARAYAQFVTGRSGIAHVINSFMNARNRDRWPYQWRDDDFGPIDDAFGQVLGDLGWLK